jgi:hypothetical protein
LGSWNSFETPIALFRDRAKWTVDVPLIPGRHMYYYRVVTENEAYDACDTYVLYYNSITSFMAIGQWLMIGFATVNVKVLLVLVAFA